MNAIDNALRIIANELVTDKGKLASAMTGLELNITTALVQSRLCKWIGEGTDKKLVLTDHFSPVHTIAVHYDSTAFGRGFVGIIQTTKTLDILDLWNTFLEQDESEDRNERYNDFFNWLVKTNNCCIVRATDQSFDD